MTDNVIKLFEGGDPRLGELATDIIDVIMKRCEQIPLASTLGVLDIVHDFILQSAKE